MNRIWERRLLDGGADFVRFVGISSLPSEATGGFPTAVLFGKALSREYLRAVLNGLPPKTKEVFNTERKMDALADRCVKWLEEDGYRGVCRLKAGQLPHKTVALRAGLGFIGKNNLLVTPEYGCGVMLGKVLTDAPFVTQSTEPAPPQCGDCSLCVSVCPGNALHGTAWDVTKKREDILTRKLCTLCARCMAVCPFTVAYVG